MRGDSCPRSPPRSDDAPGEHMVPPASEPANFTVHRLYRPVTFIHSVPPPDLNRPQVYPASVDFRFSWAVWRFVARRPTSDRRSGAPPWASDLPPGLLASEQGPATAISVARQEEGSDGQATAVRPLQGCVHAELPGGGTSLSLEAGGELSEVLCANAGVSDGKP